MDSPPLAYLIVLIQCIEITCLDKLPRCIIAEAYSVVEISQPYDCIVVFDGSIPLEAKTIADCTIVTIAFFVVSKTSREMGGYEADAGVRIFHSYGHRPFVSRHARHASLLIVSSGSLDARSSFKHTFFTLPSTFLILCRMPAFTKIMSAAPTSCPLRNKMYSSDECLRALSFNVRLTAFSHAWRLTGSVDMICCGLSSTISWKPTATMPGCCCSRLISGHNQAARSSLTPLPRPFRLKVPTQICTVSGVEYSLNLGFCYYHDNSDRHTRHTSS